MQIPLNNFILFCPIDFKLGIWVTYVKIKLEINTQVSLIKVKVSVAKNRNSVSAE